MKQNSKNEELQSRREFFKKAAKGALPILGIAIMANVPMISNASESEYCTCAGNCSGGCRGTCVTGCSTGCNGNCSKTCQGSCYKGCSTTCQGR